MAFFTMNPKSLHPRFFSRLALASRFSTARRRRGAIGWSLMYLVFGGGLLGALVIFAVLKFFGH